MLHWYPQQGKETPSELVMFTGESDARKFFYLFENVLMKDSTDEEKAEKVVCFLSGQAFYFDFDRFTMDNSPNSGAKDYATVKKIMLEKFSTQKTEAEIMKDAVTLSYDGGDIKAFITKAEKAYNQAKFNDSAKFGLLREALNGDHMLLQFVLFRGAKDYISVKKACLEFAENKKMLDSPSSVPTATNTDRKDERIDELCKQIENLHLLMSKQNRPPRVSEPKCHRCKKTGHYASQCQLPPEPPLVCTYCCKHDHRAEVCYTKQCDDSAKAQRITILKKEDAQRDVETKEALKPQNMMFLSQMTDEDEEEPVAILNRAPNG